MFKVLQRSFFICLSILICLGFKAAHASIDPPYEMAITGPVKAQYFFNTPTINWTDITSISIQNKVSLRILDDKLIKYTFSYAVKVQIDRFTDHNTTAFTSDTVTLHVNYVRTQGSTCKMVDTYDFQGAYKIKVTVLDVTANSGVAPDANVIQLSSSITIDRQYKFQPGHAISPAYTVNKNKLGITWSPVSGAEEYDIEWTTVNNGNNDFLVIDSINHGKSTTTIGPALNRVFRNNSSRITTSANSETLTLIYTDPYLLVRIRQVQYNNGIRLSGVWDYKMSGGGYFIVPLTWNEGKLNWQYAAAFAEDGKKKEVISYFDGTLRGRQTVTINNTDNVPIAQENVYDEFGRPAASILPAPFIDTLGVTYLHYVPYFNSAAVNNAPYTFANVKGTFVANCETNPDSLNISSGASRYYSANNKFLGLQKYNSYIPDAGGYPLSVTQYTADNTGRIKIQGGVGAAFQPGKSVQTKTTKYYYGKPEQWELDQLFGNDVGYAEHYLKNMVVDPNGQISVSYLNASGKTIATALAGKSPETLDQLPSFKPTDNNTRAQTIHILKPGQFVFNSSALKLSATTTYLSAVAGPANLSFDIQKLIDKYPGGKFSICSNCYYEMTVKVMNDCGGVIASTIKPVHIGLPDTAASCNDTIGYKGTLDKIPFDVGEYHVSIDFAFNNRVIENYSDSLIAKGKRNGFIEQQFNYIKKRYLDTLDIAGCYADCHTCKQLLGPKGDFENMLTAKFLALELDSASITSENFIGWADTLYHKLDSICTNVQATCHYSPCESVQNAMLDDVSPGGQYALFDVNGNALDGTNVISNFWRDEFPSLLPTDPKYLADLVTLEDSTVTSPYDANFTLPMLIKYWKPEWALKFLNHHPELCKLTFCMNNSTYKNWDMQVQKDIDKASEVPYIQYNGTNAGLTYKSTNTDDWLLNADPYFGVNGPGYSKLSAMKADLLNYSTNVLKVPVNQSLAVKGLMGYVKFALYCSDTRSEVQTNTSVLTNTWNNCTPNTACLVPDKEWITYRDLYFELKDKYYALARDGICGGDCPVGQPTVFAAPGTPSLSEFSIALQSPTSQCNNSQTVIITHNDGPINRPCTVTLTCPSVKTYTPNIDFAKGVSQMTLCVPSDIPVNQLLVNTITYPAQYVWANLTTKDSVGFTGIDPYSTAYSTYYITRSTVSDVAISTYIGNDPANPPQPVAANRYNYTGTIWYDVDKNYLCDGCVSNGQFISDPNRYYFDISRDTYSNSLNFNNANTLNANINSPNYTYLEVTDASNHTIKFSLGFEFQGYNRIWEIEKTIPAITLNANTPSAGCAAYANKTPRFPVYKNNLPSTADLTQGGTDQLQADTKTAIKAQAASMCEGNADTWMARLKPGLDELAKTTTVDTVQLRAALIDVCAAGGDVTHALGASTLPAQTQSSLGYTSFGDVISKLLLGSSTTFTPKLNPWLIDAPYPYAPHQQSVAKTIGNTSPGFCAVLTDLNAKALAANSTLYNYLVATYKDAMNITQADLDVLQKSCGNCRFLMDQEVALPVFMDENNPGCITPTQYNAAKTELFSKFGTPTTLTTTDPAYKNILSNYMNHKWGFSLTYDNYYDYDSLINKASGTALLCNKTPYRSVSADPYACAKTAIEVAVSSGKADYDAYLADNKRKFRINYINTCKLAQANANLSTVQQVYHYTLYYYDQADNLVRTVPPEGVHPIDTAKLKWIADARDIDPGLCAGTFDLVSNAGIIHTDHNGDQKTPAFNSLSTILSTTTGASIELWLYNPTGQANQMMEETPDHQYMLQVCICGNLMNVDVYTSTQTGSNKVKYTRSNHCTLNIAGLLPLHPWAHVVVRSSNFTSGALQVWLNGVSPPVMAGSPRSGCSWRVSSTATAITYPDNIGTLKHLRFYNRLLPDSEIIANAGNNCFLPRSFNGLAGWYRFNVPSAGAPTTISANSTNETRLTSIYPDHTLATSYAYNSTNQVIKQHSPDGGTNLFWYDYLSRLTVSQNDKQGQYDSQGRNNYSYTAYDPLGRITEVGQKHTANTLPYSPADATVPDYADPATLKTFMASGSHSQITNTYYDAPAPVTTGNGLALLPEQANLRKRVSASTYTETQGGPAQSATYYNYDLDGNVKTLWQQIGGLWKAADTASLKRVDYEYDLVSGKVNFVRYQQNQPDQFYYQYQYDAENRLTHAWSGTRAMLNADAGSQLLIDNKKLDAYYQYYLHGPLARLELGDEHGKVQGIDYAYTLQGWLKGVNGTSGAMNLDIGGDGTGTHSTIPKDAYGYALHYYNGDYKAIGGTAATAFADARTAPGYRPLYNGNIAASSLNVGQLGKPLLYVYGYDQLNRLKRQNAFKGLDTLNNIWHPIGMQAYAEKISYDASGNILTYNRHGADTTGMPVAMDSLTYAYNRDANGNIINNRLRHVTDAVPDANNYTADLKTQPADNYQYDALGNLIKDTQAGIDTINWTVYGKIKSIIKPNAANNIAYIYDAAGHRVSKTVNGLTTYYVRDAQGNTLALYDNANNAVNWREQHLYGSSRLGIWTPNVNLANNNALAVWNTAGLKFFELTNHLGNVIETITDRRIQVAKDTSIAYYTADVATAQDYYPFGMLMPGRQYTVSGNNYRYGFNGKENDNEVKQDANGNNIIGSQQDYGRRIYDDRVGRFLSLDPLQAKYPWFTPYQFAGNSPIANIDLDGLENANYNLVLSKGSNGKPTLSIQYANTEKKDFLDDIANGLFLGRNEGEPSHAVLNYQGQRVAVFNSFQEMKEVTHGKTIRQIEEWEGNRVKAALEMAAVTHGVSNGMDLADEYVQAKISNSVSPSEVASMEAVAANGGNIEAAEESASLPNKKAAQLRSNNDVSKLSEGIVRDNLTSQLGDNQILMIKPRIYINDDAGKATSNYATPDFAILDRETGKIVKIVDAKNGNAGLTDPQKALQKNGGSFKGSSRAPAAKPQKIAPNSIQVERTNVSGTGN